MNGPDYDDKRCNVADHFSFARGPSYTCPGCNVSLCVYCGWDCAGIRRADKFETCDVMFCSRCVADPKMIERFACQKDGGCKSLKMKNKNPSDDEEKKFPDPCALYCECCAEQCYDCGERLCSECQKKSGWLKGGCHCPAEMCDKFGHKNCFVTCKVCKDHVSKRCAIENSSGEQICGGKHCRD